MLGKIMHFNDFSRCKMPHRFGKSHNFELKLGSITLDFNLILYEII